MKKRLAPLLLIIILLIVVVVFSIKGKMKAVDTSNPREISFNIPEGSSVSRIAEILEEEGLISSKNVFKFKLRTHEDRSRLKSGDYNLSTGLDMDEIIGELVEGPDLNIIKFNIPEGYELRQIADRLEELDLIDRAEFLSLVSNKGNFEDDFEFLKELEPGQSLEGFLYPASYEVFKNDSERAIINRMLKAFENIYNKEIKAALVDSKLDLNGLVTLASIVEREGKLDQERPLMAAVFYNRLDIGMNLGSCATVQFILGERKPVLSTADTRIPSEYNTYIHKGLPPAPIASPGEKSILATINPADVDYLYFVKTGEDGSHTFTKTFEDHKKAKKNMK